MAGAIILDAAQKRRRPQEHAHEDSVNLGAFSYGCSRETTTKYKAFISIRDYEHLEVDKSLEKSKAGFYTLEGDII